MASAVRQMNTDSALSASRVYRMPEFDAVNVKGIFSEGPNVQAAKPGCTAKFSAMAADFTYRAPRKTDILEVDGYRYKVVDVEDLPFGEIVLWLRKDGTV